MIFVPVVLINYIRDLKKLTPISLAANFLVILAFLGVLYYLFRGSWENSKAVMVTETLHTLPLFLGTMMFALEAVGVVSCLHTVMFMIKEKLHIGEQIG